ncbi:hypothetical protein [Streptomyces yanii]|uniref:Uncharacterized protein n=1 Tax=Streptomyces yanii TaxID=78510 RepID=A0ABV5R7Z9_9ACTN
MTTVATMATQPEQQGELDEMLAATAVHPCRVDRGVGRGEPLDVLGAGL